MEALCNEKRRTEKSLACSQNWVLRVVKDGKIRFELYDHPLGASCATKGELCLWEINVPLGQTVQLGASCALRSEMCS